MLKCTHEVMLAEYFLHKAVFGSNMDDKEIFDLLSKHFLLSNEEAEQLFALAESPAVKGITSEAKFNQYQRLRKYAELVGMDVEIDSRELEAVLIKGNAFAKANALKLTRSNEDCTLTGIFGNLFQKATEGDVTSCRLLGVLQCQGTYGVGADFQAGCKLLERAARWNDVPAMLAAMYYSKDSRAVNMGRFAVVVGGGNSVYGELFSKAQSVYGVYDANREAKLLEKAFGHSMLDRTRYSSRHSRIVFSEIIGYRDRERVILSGENCQAISELPVKLKRTEFVPKCDQAFADMPLQRKDEQAEIVRALQNSDLRFTDAYRPLCVVCDSRYVVNLYREALAKMFADCKTETIDVTSLHAYDVEPTANNVFLRDINEGKTNVFFIMCFGNVAQEAEEGLKQFLQGSGRKKFRLGNPRITLDLSAVIPVCFCDRENAKLFRRHCDVVNLSVVAEGEKQNVVADLIKRLERSHKVKKISVDSAAMKKLVTFKPETAEEVLDKAVRSARKGGEAISLTTDFLQQFFRSEASGFGFGGAAHEIK